MNKPNTCTEFHNPRRKVPQNPLHKHEARSEVNGCRVWQSSLQSIDVADLVDIFESCCHEIKSKPYMYPIGTEEITNQLNLISLRFFTFWNIQYM